MNYLIIFMIIIFCFSFLTGDVDGIINGAYGTQLMFNYMVSLWHSGDFICGGLILDQRHILTAAHCVYKSPCPSAYTIQAGTTHWFTSAVIIRVLDIQIHPSFSYIDGHQLNDLAILTLRNPLILSPIIQNITLPSDEDTLPYCAVCTIAGWGSTTLEDEKTPTPGLHYAEFDILSPEDCRNHIHDIRDNELCAKDPLSLRSTAAGDSGAPLVCNGIVYGVHSDGCCNPQIPAIMVNVIKHLDFIRYAVQN